MIDQNLLEDFNTTCKGAQGKIVSKIDHFHVTEVGLKIMCFFKGSNLSGRTNWFAANAFSMEEACSIVHYMHIFFSW